jgi:alpha-amylase
MRKLKMTFIGFGAALMMCLAPAITAQEATELTDETNWWNERVFYQVFVRSFYDSDGDGTGDFQGLIEKLDYLNDGDPATTDDLGVTGIWLMPVMPSPTEHGYDVTDYLGVNPDYGTVEDFRQFVDEAHARGIAVIIDLVVNHSSSEHPWFEASAADDPEYADYYVWSETDPGFRGPDSQTVWHTRGDRWYYGVFYYLMPDLNYTNPDVTAEMYEIARFWLEEMDVDGFRVDAVKYVIEEGRALENTSATHAWLEAFHDYVKSIKPDALLVGEIWESTALVVPYVPDEMDIAFEFDLAEALVQSGSFGLAGTLTRALEPVLEAYPDDQFATFLTNHDQDRFISQAQGKTDAARLAGYMLLTLPGVPFVYYGEEVGMEGRRTLSDTDNERRRPMQWDDSANAGFTSGTPWFPLNDNADEANVAAQEDDPNSVLNAYRDMIQLRGRTPALQTGDLLLLESTHRKVLAFLRHSPGQAAVLIVINTDDRPVTEYAINGALEIDGPISAANLLYGEGDVNAPTVRYQGTSAILDAYTPLTELAPYSATVIDLLP